MLTAELPTIDSGGLDAVRENLAPFGEYVDAVNVTDNAGAHAHASSLAVAIALTRLGAEPIMQMVCRDRNRLGLEADIAGAALHGVENLLCLRGDNPEAGDEPDAAGVFELGALELIAAARGMAEGRYLSGRKLEPAPQLFVGAVETPGEGRVERALQKVETGARFMQLQFCFEPETLESFVADAVERGLASSCALLPSIFLAASPKSLRYMDEHVPGVSIPRETIERCENAADPAEACFQLALELARHALAVPGVAGLHLISFRREAGIARLCRELGIPTREEREASGYRNPRKRAAVPA